MRIAFDLDGVLADLHMAFARTAISLYPELDRPSMAAPELGASPPPDEDDAGYETEVPEAPPLPDSVLPPLDRRQQDAVWKRPPATENFWEGLTEIESGAIKRLAVLADERRWDVLFITS